MLLLKFENLAAKLVLHYEIFFGSLQFYAKMLVIRLYPSVMKNLRPKYTIVILMKVKSMEVPAFNLYFSAPGFTFAYDGVVG